MTALLQAVDDENAKVRLEAIYATGVIAQAPLAADQVQRLTRRSITTTRRSAPRRRASSGGSSWPRRADALIKAINDSQAERALRRDARPRRHP